MVRNMKPTGIVRDPIYLQHEMGHYHPESPRRLEVIYSMISTRLSVGAISGSGSAETSQDEIP